MTLRHIELPFTCSDQTVGWEGGRLSGAAAGDQHAGAYAGQQNGNHASLERFDG